jgi:putative intracellular protease/amidase
MEIAILLFDRLTALDAIGPYEVLRSAPGTTVKFVSRERGEKRTDAGSLGLTADYTLDEVTKPEIVVIPGGPGQIALMEDKEVLDWVRRVHKTSRWTTSVCTGSLVLAAAGLLNDAPATTHWLALDTLGQLGARPMTERVGGSRQDHHRGRCVGGN